MKTRLLEIITLIAACALLWSCATNSALSLIKASKSSDPVIPGKNIIDQELKGRAFKPGKVNYAHDVIIENLADIPDKAYPVLLRAQLQKAFQSAALEQGEFPAYQIDITINQLKFTKGAFIIPDPSILHVTMEVIQPDGTTVMRGDFESRFVPMIPVIVPGVVGAIPTRFEGHEWQALGKTIPAMAVAITRVIAGLKAGKGLDEIEVYPEVLEAGSIINPDSFLRGKPYGLSELTSDDIAALVKIDVQDHDQYDLKMITCQTDDFFPDWKFEGYQENVKKTVIPFKKNVVDYLGAHFEGNSFWYRSACHLAIYDTIETAINAFKWHEQVASNGLEIAKESDVLESTILRNISIGNKAFYLYTPLLLLEEPIHTYSILIRRGRAVLYMILGLPKVLSEDEVYKMAGKIDLRLHGEW